MCNTGLLKADITPRPNNPPLRNEALHVHVHLPPPERVPLVVLSCVPGPWRTLIPTSSCLFGTLNYFSSLFRLAENRTRDLLGAPPWGALAENRTRALLFHVFHFRRTVAGIEPATF